MSTASGPLVTLLIPTFNRRASLGEAIGSAVRQLHRNLEILVINDGGADVADIVQPFNDARVVLIQNKENRGKACCLNQAIALARGKYIAYLDDDDVHYPNHISSLVAALEANPQAGVAYSNLYRTACRVGPDGKRVALGKYLEIVRDFDRFFMFHFNLVLHVSVMHRKELIEKTGPYNEKVKILIDWDMTRRLAFYSDFIHVDEATGEYSIPEAHSDRISHRMRKDPAQYERTIRMIRATRPPKPWPKVKDLSIVCLPRRMNLAAASMLGAVHQHTFVPHKVYLPMGADELQALDSTDMPNLVPVTIDRSAPIQARLDACLAQCEGDVVAIVPEGTPVGDAWVEQALYALVNNPQPKVGYMLRGPADGALAAVIRKDELLAARSAGPASSIRQSLLRAGLSLRSPTNIEMPFMFDDLLHTATALEEDGDWDRAAEIYSKLPGKFSNRLWMNERTAAAMYNLGTRDPEALALCQEINSQRPTVESLLLEAKLQRRLGQLERSAGLLQEARHRLQWKG